MAVATIYTTKTCAYCHMVEKFLEKKGIPYKTVSLEEEPQTRQKLFEKLGAMTVPITNLGDKWVVGWNVAKLQEAINGQVK